MTYEIVARFVRNGRLFLRSIDIFADGVTGKKHVSPKLITVIKSITFMTRIERQNGIIQKQEQKLKRIEIILIGKEVKIEKPEDNNHVAGSPGQNAGAGDQRKRERVQSSKQIDRGSKEKGRRVGETTAKSVTPKKSLIVRKKKKVKEDIGPRL